MRPDQNAVFIAYARADAPFVLELATKLRAAGASLWVDQLDIPPGAHWDQNVEESLSCCARVLVVLSPAAVASQNVLDEVSYALEARKEIIPVLYQPCLIPLRLKRLQYIDLTGSYEAGFRRLLDSLGARAQPTAPQPVAQPEPVPQPVSPAAERPRSAARLHLFSGVSLEGERGPIAGRGAQRRRLALLAILATSRRGISRDKLIGYLWEEADTERARRVLSEAIYVIRKSLGEDAVLTSGDEVRLNPRVVWSDVTAFNDALENEQLTSAVELYRGPFLDGFFISDALEFDQWAERERDRFARAHADALQKLADQAEAGGDFRAAARWWRKLTEHDKYGAATTIGLMRALDAAGDRAAALLEARAYATRMRTDLEAEPDAQVEAFAQLLRDAPPGPLPERVPAPARPLAVATLPAPPVAAAPTAAPAVALKPGRRALLIGVVALLFVATAVITWMIVQPPPPPAPGAQQMVAVLPFVVGGDDPTLREGAARLLSMNLDGAGELRSVDTHALGSAAENLGQGYIAPAVAARFVKRFGARYFVLGTAVPAGETVRLAVTMYDVQDSVHSVAEANNRGSIDNLHLLIDSLSTGLLANFGGQFMKAAASTATSWDAFKHLVAGDVHFRRGQYDSAVYAFRRAINTNPRFALAHYRLSAAAEWNFDFFPARVASAKAVEHSSQLSEEDQSVVSAWDSFLNGRFEHAERNYNLILDQHPIHVEAQSGLAEVLVHYNPIRGQPIAEAKKKFDRILELVPDYGEARFHALEFAARDREEERFDTLFTRLSPRNPQHLAWRAVRAFTFGTPADQRTVLLALDTANQQTVGIAAARLAAHTHNFPGAAQIAEKLLRSRQNDWKAAAHILLAQVALGGGDWSAARQHLRDAEQLEPDWSRELSALYTLHPAAEADTQQILAERDKVNEWHPETHTPSMSFFFAAHADVHGILRLYLLELLSVKAGDLQAAHTYRVQLRDTKLGPAIDPIRRGLVKSLDGHLALARNDSLAALEHLRNARIPAWPEKLALSPFFARSHDRWTIAQIYRHLGKTREAELWERSLVEGYDFVWAGLVLR